ncbi:MAG: hypothetical protein M0036_14210 [Desulfobacteraceae bacterium]|nr:hypothetical protein [Desulfobacteraceae bacterium]
MSGFIGKGLLSELLSLFIFQGFKASIHIADFVTGLGDRKKKKG